MNTSRDSLYRWAGLTAIVAVCLSTLFLARSPAAPAAGESLSLSVDPEILTSGDVFETEITGGDPGSLPLLFFGRQFESLPGFDFGLDIVPEGFWILPLFGPSGQIQFDHQTPTDISMACDETFLLQVAQLSLPPGGGDFEVEVSNVFALTFNCQFCDHQGSGRDKPRLLAMEYTGEDCAATSHSQDPNLVTCSGDPAFETPVRIVAADKPDPDNPTAHIWFDGQVDLGEIYEIDAANAGQSRLSGETYVFVYDLMNNLLQVVSFHTSCSQPLDANDQFGAHRVAGVLTESTP